MTSGARQRNQTRPQPRTEGPAPVGICIDRCICFGQTIDQLLRVAREQEATTVEDLARHVDFGQKCGLCRPYVSRALQTGQTHFDEILIDAPSAEPQPETEKRAG